MAMFFGSLFTFSFSCLLWFLFFDDEYKDKDCSYLKRFFRFVCSGFACGSFGCIVFSFLQLLFGENFVMFP